MARRSAPGVSSTSLLNTVSTGPLILRYSPTHLLPQTLELGSAMPGNAAKVTITERQQDALRTMTRSGTCPQALAQRARMILLAFDGASNDQIAEGVGCERHTPGIWRRRW